MVPVFSQTKRGGETGQYPPRAREGVSLQTESLIQKQALITVWKVERRQNVVHPVLGRRVMAGEVC